MKEYKKSYYKKNRIKINLKRKKKLRQYWIKYTMLRVKQKSKRKGMKSFIITLIMMVGLFIWLGFPKNIDSSKLKQEFYTNYQRETLRVLEDIRDNGDEILSKLDTICDRL